MLPTKARICANIRLVNNAIGQISYKKVKLRKKQTEIEIEKVQTVTQLIDLK